MNPDETVARRNRRDANLDLIRATAISLVLIHHTGIMWPITQPTIRSLCSLGMYGVDLFFVLSGWLIGGLFWREQFQFGSVAGFRFWMRRAVRTMPPYFVAFPIAWLAVFVSRQEPFDWRYLLFLQNYERRIPYFVVSWSLCVEEHFYFLLPLFAFVCRYNRLMILVWLICLSVVSPIARCCDPMATAYSPFGYAETATHLRLSGISLGALCAYLAVAAPEFWNRLQTMAQVLLAPSCLLWLSIPWWSLSARYYCGNEVSTFLSACTVAAIAGQPSLRVAQTKIVSMTALCSYSIYLTHGLVLHVWLRVISKSSYLPSIVHLGMLYVFVATAGWLYYLCIERVSIQLRDILIPRGQGVKRSS